MRVLEGGGEMVEKHCWVVLLKLLDEPPLLFDRQLVTECDMLSELFQALEGGLLSSLLELTCRHLLTEGERYTATTKQRQVLVCTLDPDSTVRKCVICVNVRATLFGSWPCCRVRRAFVTASIRDAGI